MSQRMNKMTNSSYPKTRPRTMTMYRLPFVPCCKSVPSPFCVSQIYLQLYRIDKGPTGRSIQPDEPVCTKIYYASRTHSQLTQILPELRKLDLYPLPPSNSASDTSSRIPHKRN